MVKSLGDVIRDIEGIAKQAGLQDFLEWREKREMLEIEEDGEKGAIKRGVEENELEGEAEGYYGWCKEQKMLEIEEDGEKGGVPSDIISRLEVAADVFVIRDENNQKYVEVDDVNLWEWVSAQCWRLGWSLAARIAAFLGVQERKIWDSRHRSRWLDNYRYYDEYMYNTKHPADFLVALVSIRDFKMGCFVSGYECKYCQLAEKQGACNQKGSLPYFWECVLGQESGEVLDEKRVECMKKTLDWMELR